MRTLDKRFIDKLNEIWLQDFVDSLKTPRIAKLLKAEKDLQIKKPGKIVSVVQYKDFR